MSDLEYPEGHPLHGWDAVWIAGRAEQTAALDKEPRNRHVSLYWESFSALVHEYKRLKQLSASKGCENARKTWEELHRLRRVVIEVARSSDMVHLTQDPRHAQSVAYGMESQIKHLKLELSRARSQLDTLRSAGRLVRGNDGLVAPGEKAVADNIELDPGLGFDLHQALEMGDEDGDLLSGVHRLRERAAKAEARGAELEDECKRMRSEVKRANGNAERAGINEDKAKRVAEDWRAPFSELGTLLGVSKRDELVPALKAKLSQAESRIRDLQEECASHVRLHKDKDDARDALALKLRTAESRASRAEGELSRVNLNKHEENKSAAIRWAMGKPEVHPITPEVQDGRWLNTVSKSRWNGYEWESIGMVNGWIDSFDGEVPDCVADRCAREEEDRRRHRERLDEKESSEATFKQSDCGGLQTVDMPAAHLAKLDEILVAVKELGNG